jgi:hypothetical protein
VVIGYIRGESWQPDPRMVSSEELAQSTGGAMRRKLSA